MHIRSTTARWTALWAACALTMLGAGPAAAEAEADEAGTTAASADEAAGTAKPEYTDIDSFFEEALGDSDDAAAPVAETGQAPADTAGPTTDSDDETGPAPVSAATAAGAGAVDAGPADVGSAAVDAASGDDENVYARAGEITLDALLMRPLGAVATVAGFGFYVAASPFLVVSGDLDSARDAFVVERARYTFDRPLGRF